MADAKISQEDLGRHFASEVQAALRRYSIKSASASIKASGRHDIKLPLSDVAPDLDIKNYAGGAKFVDKANPQYEGGTDLAYDFNTLEEEGFIVIDYMKTGQDRAGGATYSDPAVKVTLEGYKALREWKGD